MSYIEKRPKTIFSDIDGTLVEHVSPFESTNPNHKMKLLPGTIEKLQDWDMKGYYIILTTGRKESSRDATIKQLQRARINYDQLIMGFGGGDRILINDRKPNNPNRDTAYVINLERNKGLVDEDNI